MKIVIADASCLITLDNIDEPTLLRKLYASDITGTFGLVVNGIELGSIATPTTILDRLEKAGFRISNTLKDSLRTMIH